MRVLQVIAKQKVLQYDQKEHLLSEKAILAEIDHPCAASAQGLTRAAPHHRMRPPTAGARSVRAQSARQQQRTRIARLHNTGRWPCGRFCIQLVATFKDATRLYMVLEYCPGGELFSLLQRERMLPDKHCVFYAASVMPGATHPVHSSQCAQQCATCAPLT